MVSVIKMAMRKHIMDENDEQLDKTLISVRADLIVHGIELMIQ
jgi:hypothetical protein